MSRCGGGLKRSEWAMGMKLGWRARTRGVVAKKVGRSVGGDRGRIEAYGYVLPLTQMSF